MICAAWKQSDRYACKFKQACHAIGPVGFAAEQADDDEFCVGEGFLRVQINGIIVLQLQEIGEAQTGFELIGGQSKGCQFTVGGCEDDDVAGRLLEIDGDCSAVDHACCGSEKMHQSRSDALMAAWSMCFSPITTRRVDWRSCAPHGLSK